MRFIVPLPVVRLALLALSALATLLTAILTFWLGTAEHFPLAAVLGLAAGMFIYIAASDLIPTIHREAKGQFAHLSLLLLILGAFVVWGVSEYSHQKLHEATQTHETRDNHISPRHDDEHVDEH